MFLHRGDFNFKLTYYASNEDFFLTTSGNLGFCHEFVLFNGVSPTDGDCKFVIKKVDGKRQWGMVSAWDEREYIPCQYDSIFLSTMRRITLRFVCGC